MFPDVKKRQCKDRISMACKDMYAYGFLSFERMVNTRKEFDFKISTILEQQFITYDDIYNMFDEEWKESVKDDKDIYKIFGEEIIDLFIIPCTILNSMYPRIPIFSIERIMFRIIKRPYDLAKLFNNYLDRVEKRLNKYIDEYDE